MYDVRFIEIYDFLQCNQQIEANWGRKYRGGKLICGIIDINEFVSILNEKKFTGNLIESVIKFSIEVIKIFHILNARFRTLAQLIKFIFICSVVSTFSAENNQL